MKTVRPETATARAIIDSFQSPNVSDSNGEAANLVDVVQKLCYSMDLIAHSITAPAAGGTDETGGHIESLTEAVMGVTAGLCRIAQSIGELAEAIRESKLEE